MARVEGNNVAAGPGLAEAQAERRYDLVTLEDLAMLKDFAHRGCYVVSVYLDVRPQEREDQKYLLHYRNMVSDWKKATAGRPDWQKPILEDMERIESWLAYTYDRTGRGLALFACHAAGLWRAYRLPAAVRNRLVVDARPYIRPLAMLADEYERYGVLLVNKEIARVFLVYMGEIEEYVEVEGELVPRPKAGGWSAEKYQRHHDMHVLWHAKDAIRALEALYERQPFQRLLIGGTEEPVAEVLRRLPEHLAARLAGRISIPVKAPEQEVLERTLEVEQAIEREVEARRLEEVITTAQKGGPAVLGVDDTLGAISEQRVRLLLVEEDFHLPGYECPQCGLLLAVRRSVCPVCGHALQAIVDVVERAMERVLDQKAELDVVRGESRARLAEQGHLGALLRF
jgi:peptide chain release factor subunit 1